MKKNLNYIFIFSTILLLLNCSENRVGKKIPKDMVSANISKVIKDPKPYIKKETLLTGTFSSGCTTSDCCKEFFLNSGINQIKVNYDGMTIPKIKKNSPIKILGNINTTATSIYFQLKGIEILK